MPGTGRLRRLLSRRLRAVSLEEGYARWAPLYPPHPHNPVMRAESAIVERLVTKAAPHRALDVGTGTGRNLAVLAAAGAELVVGVDLSRAMIACGERSRLRVCCDACQLPFAASTFDIVCSSLMCGDVADLAVWLGEATRVLTPGGHLVYSDFHPSWHTQGWRRTFVGDDRRTYELPLFPHAIEEHHAQLRQHALEIRSFHEPTLDGGDTPILAIFHAYKPTHTGER